MKTRGWIPDPTFSLKLPLCLITPRSSWRHVSVAVFGSCQPTADTFFVLHQKPSERRTYFTACPAHREVRPCRSVRNDAATSALKGVLYKTLPPTRPLVHPQLRAMELYNGIIANAVAFEKMLSGGWWPYIVETNRHQCPWDSFLRQWYCKGIEGVFCPTRNVTMYEHDYYRSDFLKIFFSFYHFKKISFFFFRN